MDYSEFTELCRAEWANGFGNVVGLDLTDTSRAEFHGPHTNPVTGDPVGLGKGAIIDTVTVRYGPDWCEIMQGKLTDPGWVTCTVPVGEPFDSPKRPRRTAV